MHAYRELNFFRRHLSPGILLDLGCGGGKELFAETATISVGIDNSIAALRQCSRYYDMILQGDLLQVPFEDSSFDFVVTSHVGAAFFL